MAAATIIPAEISIDRLRGLVTQLEENVKDESGIIDEVAMSEVIQEIHTIGIQIMNDEVEHGHCDIETPLHTSFRIITIMQTDSIQSSDPLRLQLSKVNQIFSEILLFRCFKEDRPIGLEKKRETLHKIDDVSKLIRYKDVETKFHLSAAKSALRATDGEEGILSIFKSTLKKSELSKKGVSTGIKTVWDSEHVPGWFRKSFGWSWLARGITTQKEMSCLEGFDKASIKDKNLAFRVLEVIMIILHNKDAKPELKKNLIKGSGSKCSLYYLASSKHETVRRFAMQYLIQLSDLALTETETLFGDSSEDIVSVESSGFSSDDLSELPSAETLYIQILAERLILESRSSDIYEMIIGACSNRVILEQVHVAVLSLEDKLTKSKKFNHVITELERQQKTGEQSGAVGETLTPEELEEWINETLVERFEETKTFITGLIEKLEGS